MIVLAWETVLYNYTVWCRLDFALVVAPRWFSTFFSLNSPHYTLLFLIKGIDPIIPVVYKGCSVRRSHLHGMEPSSYRRYHSSKDPWMVQAPVLLKCS